MKLKDIETLHTDGFITDDQRTAIIDYYRLRHNGSGRWLSLCLSLLSVALIVGGAGMLVEAHWEALSALQKTALGMGVLAAVWVAYFAFRKRLPLMAEGLAVIGAGLWAANIALHEHLFQPDTPDVEGLFLFFVGIALIPFFTRQRLLIGIVAASSLALLLSMVESTDSWLSLSWRKNDLDGNTCAALFLLGVFWWLVSEKARKAKGILAGYHWLSFPIFITWLIIVQSRFLYMPEFCLMLDETGYILLSAAPVLCLLMKPKGTSWLCWFLLAGATCLLIPLIIHLSWHSEHRELIGTAACTLYAIILMFVGVRSNRIARINYGALMSIFVLIGVISNIFKSLENSGIALIIAGVVILVFILLLEKQRRRLVKKIKQQIPPVPQL